MATATTTGTFPARTKTQKSLKANILRLTTPTGEYEGMWQLAERDTAHAREAMERWVASGAIEKISLHNGYSTGYRVTGAGLDEAARREARVEYLAACIAIITEQDVVYGGALVRVRTGGEGFLQSLAAIDVEDSVATMSAAQRPMHAEWSEMAQAWNDLRYAAGIIQQERRKMEQEQERIEATGDDYAAILADARARAGAATSAPAANEWADPLGGDA